MNILALERILCQLDKLVGHWLGFSWSGQLNAVGPGVFFLKSVPLSVHHCLDQLAEISEGAKREARLEMMLTKMQQEWESQELELTTFRDTDISIL